MPVNQNVERMAEAKSELREFNQPPFPRFPPEAVTGDPNVRVKAVAEWNKAMVDWQRQVTELLAQWLLLIKES